MLEHELLNFHFSGASEALWGLSTNRSSRRYFLAAPEFEINGQLIRASGQLLPSDGTTHFNNGVFETSFSTAVNSKPAGRLDFVIQSHRTNPVVRFRYILRSNEGFKLTKKAGRDQIVYLNTSLLGLSCLTEVRVSDFNELIHSFCLSEIDIPHSNFENYMSLMGPLVVASDESQTLLLGYEHGSQSPDMFLAYGLSPDRTVKLAAVKGNYYAGQIVDSEHSFITPWFHAALIDGSCDDMAGYYRSFVLNYMTPNLASRRPEIFYNTWNFQERNKTWNGKTYLDSITQERILAEIDVAHEMGIEVFVIDTGWYEKTGDWIVNGQRFPDGLQTIRTRLAELGMKLGLWFNPVVAALSSQMRAKHKDCLMTVNGMAQEPHDVWETEASQGMCLVSRYWEAFADELIRLNRELGVSYFKWDAISQYGCDSPNHFHGTSLNKRSERAQSYAFQQVGYMTKVVDKLCAACPEAVVDFDITEGSRSVGLAFLSAGKYFLINNGPYSHNYDMPDPADGNVNLFFRPGPARASICRTPLMFDQWIPSILFLTHYLPDDVYTRFGWKGPEELRSDTNQWISLASLVLGQNGIWGDLLSLSDEGVCRFRDTLAMYRSIRADITSATIKRNGVPGASPEIYEKIAANGRGVVSIFANTSGIYTFITSAKVACPIWHNHGVKVSVTVRELAHIEAHFDEPGAKLIFFGAQT